MIELVRTTEKRTVPFMRPTFPARECGTKLDEWSAADALIVGALWRLRCIGLPREAFQPTIEKLRKEPDAPFVHVVGRHNKHTVTTQSLDPLAHDFAVTINLERLRRDLAAP